MRSIKKLFKKRRQAPEKVQNYKLTITHQLDAKFKELAGKLPAMQITVAGIPQTLKGKPLFVDHHAEILCRYAQAGERGVELYCADVVKKHKGQMKVVK